MKDKVIEGLVHFNFTPSSSAAKLDVLVLKMGTAE